MSFLLAASRHGGVGMLRRGAAGMPRSSVLMAHQHQQPRQMSTLKTMYKYVFRSNATYVTYIVVGVVVLEAIYGKAIDTLWDSVNKGKQFKDVDWSKFKSDDDEEEE
ncbi:ubiquinol-cytochrome C reductase [Tribonema minus]|uniref:Ubiquinol-cytochrome C reductase n=1 Tax=Tribonema minus TaxID=303371 RepID=A0A836C8S1_9STRA|nr:ubiquinol-cytochrome C reductase [Tribonema minus]